MVMALYDSLLHMCVLWAQMSNLVILLDPHVPCSSSDLQPWCMQWSSVTWQPLSSACTLGARSTTRVWRTSRTLSVCTVCPSCWNRGCWSTSRPPGLSTTASMPMRWVTWHDVFNNGGNKLRPMISTIQCFQIPDEEWASAHFRITMDHWDAAIRVDKHTVLTDWSLYIFRCK